MKRKRFSEEQLIGMLKEAQAGAKTADPARRHGGVSEATIYNWKAKYGGLKVSEARRLRELESENAKLNRADAQSNCPALIPAWEKLGVTSEPPKTSTELAVLV